MDDTRNPDGGVHDIPRESGGSQPGTASKFQVGDIVSPLDRDNQGEVIAVDADRVQVRLVDKYKGTTAELFFAPAALKLTQRPTEQRALVLIEFRDLLRLPPVRWLVSEVMRSGELACLYGPPGSYKTFVALDMALCIAAGFEWWGRTVAAGPVVYIAAEGLYSVAARSKAWLQRFDDIESVEARLQQNFVVLGDAVSFLDSDFELLHDLLAELERKPVLIVVDTLARCAAGGDENSAQDMGLFVRACDRLRKLTGATVLLVHHAGKSDAKQERGSSALRGACDAMFATELQDEQERIAKLTCEKQKEGAPFSPMMFQLAVVEIGIDADERPVESGRVERIEQGQVGASTAWLDVEADPDSTIQDTLARSFFEDGAASSTLLAASALPKSTFYRHLKRLVDVGSVERFVVSGKPRYRLLPASPFYVPPAAKSEELSPSPSPTIPTESHGTDITQGPESQVSVPPPPLGGDVGRDWDGTGGVASNNPQHAESKPRRARSKQGRRPKAADEHGRDSALDARGAS